MLTPGYLDYEDSALNEIITSSWCHQLQTRWQHFPIINNNHLSKEALYIIDSWK